MFEKRKLVLLREKKFYMMIFLGISEEDPRFFIVSKLNESTTFKLSKTGLIFDAFMFELYLTFKLFCLTNGDEGRSFRIEGIRHHRKTEHHYFYQTTRNQ